MAIALEKLYGENDLNKVNIISYVELPSWLLYKLTKTTKKTRLDNYVPVIAETEKAYKIVYAKDSSISFDFIRPTYFVDYVAKSLIKNIRVDVKEYEAELDKKYAEKYK